VHGIRHVEPSKLSKPKESGNGEQEEPFTKPELALDIDLIMVYTNQSKVLHHKLRREA
jgi:hypothetical protein